MKHTGEDKPPVFSSWGGWYALLISFLLLQIVVFYLITRAFA